MGQQFPNISFSNTLISEDAVIDAGGLKQSLPITRVFEKSAIKWGKQNVLWRVEAFFMNTFVFKIRSRF